MLRRIGRRGVSAAEFAVAAPVLVLLAFGTYDIGNSIQLSLRLERAARAGAQYAAANPTNAAAIQDAVTKALSDLTADPPVAVSVTYKCDGVDMNSYAAPCPSGSPLTVTVTAQRSLSPLLLSTVSRGTGNAVFRLR